VEVYRRRCTDIGLASQVHNLVYQNFPCQECRQTLLLAVTPYNCRLDFKFVSFSSGDYVIDIQTEPTS
jgi:hypothetical protein